MKNLFKRVAAPTPVWWKKVRNIAGTIAVIAGAIIATPIALPVAIASALPVVATIAATIAGTAQCATDQE